MARYEKPDIVAHALTLAPRGTTISLADLRDAIGDSIPVEVIDDAIKGAFRSGAIVLFPEDNLRAVTWRDDISAIYLTGDRKDRLKVTQ